VPAFRAMREFTSLPKLLRAGSEKRLALSATAVVLCCSAAKLLVHLYAGFFSLLNGKAEPFRTSGGKTAPGATGSGAANEETRDPLPRGPRGEGGPPAPDRVRNL